MEEGNQTGLKRSQDPGSAIAGPGTPSSLGRSSEPLYLPGCQEILFPWVSDADLVAALPLGLEIGYQPPLTVGPRLLLAQSAGSVFWAALTLPGDLLEMQPPSASPHPSTAV